MTHQKAKQKAQKIDKWRHWNLRPEYQSKSKKSWKRRRRSPPNHPPTPV